MQWDKDLPSAADIESWQPESGKQDTLKNSLMITCQIAQARIIARADAESRFNIHNFDAGPGVEDVVREELANLLPSRYSVAAGVLNDRHGRTAGDCDLVVRDGAWSPIIKPGATSGSRRYHFPIESAYSVAEVKKTLGFSELDSAMEKLVRVARLDRPENPYGHITENQHLRALDKPGQILNPLHKSVVAIGLGEGLDFREIAQRFGAINAHLTREEMVTMLCVLGHGTAWYSVQSGKPFNATFMWDRQEPLVLQINRKEPDSAFYRFFVEVLHHLTRSVLGLLGVAASYGNPPPNRDVESYASAVFNQRTTMDGQDTSA